MNFNDIDLSGIKRFKKTLKKMQQNVQAKKKNEISLKFGSLAHDILTKMYSGTNFKVSEPQYYDGGLNIYATGRYISFDEFGTGIYAKGSYKGDLPTQTITFTTAIGVDGSGKTIRGQKSTKGWEYYYPNDYTKDLVDGRLGWWTGGNLGFQEGKVASNRFYDACQIIKAKIKEDSK